MLGGIPVSELVTLAAMMAAAGVIAGFLAGLFGIGGGAILVPVFFQAFQLVGVPDEVRMHLSVGTSLAIIIPTSLRSFMTHYRKGAVDMELLRTYLWAIPLGVLIGTLVIKVISSEGLRIVFAVIAILVAAKMIFQRDSWRLGSDLPGTAGRGIAGTVIGFLSMLMGIGGGVLNNTFMTLFGRPMHQAVATSSGGGVLISIPGFIGAVWAGWGLPGLPVFSTGYVNWICVALVIPLTLLVAPYGANLAHRLDKRRLEFGFGLFMVFVAIRFFYSVWAG